MRRSLLSLSLLIILAFHGQFNQITSSSANTEENFGNDGNLFVKNQTYFPNITKGVALVSSVPPMLIEENLYSTDYLFHPDFHVFDVLPIGDLVYFNVLANNSLFLMDVKSGNLTSFTFPNNITPFKVKLASDGSIWFTDYTYRFNDISNHLVHFFPDNQTYHAYTIQGGAVAPFDLLVEDDKIWFSMWLGNGIGYLNLATGDITTLDILCSETCGPLGLTKDATGNLWFVESYTNLIVRYNPETGSIIKFPADPDFIAPVGVTIDQDGHFWSGSHGGDLIIRFNPNTGAVDKKFYVPKPDDSEVGLAGINDLHVDQKERIWAIEHFKDSVVSLNQTSGTMIEYRTQQEEPITQFGKVFANDFWFAQFAYGIISVIPEEKQVDIQINLLDSQVEVQKGKSAIIDLEITYYDGPEEEISLDPFADALLSNLISESNNQNILRIKRGETIKYSLRVDVSKNAKISIYEGIVGFANENLRIFTNVDLVITENFVQTFILNNLGGYFLFFLLVLHKKKPWRNLRN